MRLPIIPIAVVVVLIGGAAALLTSSRPTTLVLDAPEVSSLFDVEGIETEVAIDPGGVRYAVIASGSLWLVDTESGLQTRMTSSAEVESSPAWTPDGTTITFSRGGDTFELDVDGMEETLHREHATHLEWAANGRVALVRDRALWVADSSDAEARQLVAADPDSRVSIQSPRFSPSGEQIVYVKSLAGLRGEVWIVGLDGAPPTPLISDRIAENPTSAEWINERRVVYLTDRSGGLAVWYVDFDNKDMVPLTLPLMGRALAPLGIDVRGERISVPVHVIDSDIETTHGTVLAATSRLEYDPAVSRKGDRVVYTVENEGRFELWAVGSDGADPRYITLGRHPRFSPNGNEVVYSNTDLDGNRDIWKVDIRTGVPVRLTDDLAIDETPDWSPDGRTIIFSSDRGNETHLWTIPAAGGQRLQWNDGGYAPRFSDDGGRVVFWNDGQLWRANADGTAVTAVMPAPTPTFGIWSGDEILHVVDGRIEGDIDQGQFPSRIWPVFDRLPDGGWLLSTVEVESTRLSAIDLVFIEEPVQ